MKKILLILLFPFLLFGSSPVIMTSSPYGTFSHASKPYTTYGQSPQDIVKFENKYLFYNPGSWWHYKTVIDPNAPTYTVYIPALSGGFVSDHCNGASPITSCDYYHATFTPYKNLCPNHATLTIINGVNYCGLACPAGQYPDSNNICSATACPTGQYRNSSSQCVPICETGQYYGSDKKCHYYCSLSIPSTYNNLSFHSSYTSSQDAVNFVNLHSIKNAILLSLSDMPDADFNKTGSRSGCSPYYLYVPASDNNDSNNSSNVSLCKNVSYPLFVDGYPYQGTFTTQHGCIYYINHIANGNGACKNYSGCSFTFGYYNSKDNNVSSSNPDVPLDVNISQSKINNTFDNNFSSPNHIDDPNNSVNLNPVLGQIKQLSDNQHNDLRKLFENSNIANHNLNTLINLIGGASPKLSAIKNNTKNTSDNTKNIADNTKNIADSLSGNFDSSKITLGLKNATDIFKNKDKNTTSNKDLNSSDVLSLYSNFSTKSVNALTSLFSHIDFGLNSIFAIPNFNFVDIVFPPVDIDSLHLHLHGKLLNASFFNSIDFSLVKMFLLLLTLIWSAKYIFDRLF